MSTEESQAAPPHSLGTRSARGLVYMFAGSTAAKFVAFVSQIILLWLLGLTDFGVVSLAYGVTMFIQVIEQAGIGDVLVRRRLFRLWAIPGFWFSLALGVVSCALILTSAPIAAAVYGKDESVRNELFWVLVILAPLSLANAVSVVPKAKMARELRFRAMAAVNLANLTLQKILTVVLAALGFGPYSFVIPLPISGAIMAAFLWWWLKPPFALQPQIRRWRYLVNDSTRLLAAEFGRVLLDQADYMLIGLFLTVADVGVYWVGFLFSIQVVQLLMVNLTNILFPAFTRLNDDPQRQFQGFLNAQRILAMLGVSGCLLQAAAAEPFARLMFPPRWEPSIIVVQILSLSMATRMVSGASFALLKSQGRFTAIVVNRWLSVAVLVAVLTAILSLGFGVAAVAVAVAVIGGLIGPITFYSALRPYNAGWAEVIETLARPVVCGVISVGTAWLIAQGMDRAGYGYIAQLVETVVVAVGLNVLLARLWMRPVWDDFWLRVRRLLPRRAVAGGS
jgi:O-antigen/teichoic acid export membrane protein